MSRTDIDKLVVSGDLKTIAGAWGLRSPVKVLAIVDQVVRIMNDAPKVAQWVDVAAHLKQHLRGRRTWELTLYDVSSMVALQARAVAKRSGVRNVQIVSSGEVVPFYGYGDLTTMEPVETSPDPEFASLIATGPPLDIEL